MFQSYIGEGDYSNAISVIDRALKIPSVTEDVSAFLYFFINEIFYCIKKTKIFTEFIYSRDFSFKFFILKMSVYVKMHKMKEKEKKAIIKIFCRTNILFSPNMFDSICKHI